MELDGDLPVYNDSSNTSDVDSSIDSSSGYDEASDVKAQHHLVGREDHSFLGELEVLQEPLADVEDRIVDFIAHHFQPGDRDKVYQYLQQTVDLGRIWTVRDLNSDMKDKVNKVPDANLKFFYSSQGRFVEVQKLGQGAFRIVSEVFALDQGLRHAFMRSVAGKSSESISWEVKVMRRLSELPNVLQLTHVFSSSSGNQGIMTEIMDKSLAEYLQEPLSVEEKLSIAEQMIKGVAQMHERGVMHLDVKVDNFLIRKDPKSQALEVKIADFGISVPLDESSNDLVSTNRFQASAEMLELSYKTEGKTRVSDVQQNFTCASDMWMLGAALYKVFSGSRVPWEYEVATIFDDKNISIQEKRKMAIAKIQELLPSFLDELNESSSPIYQFLVPFFALDPKQRINSKEALLFFNNKLKNGR